MAMIRVKGNVIVTEIGKALFVSSPAASQYDETKQEATILLDEAGVAKLKAQLQDLMDSAEVKESKIKDTGFVDAIFKEDTDADGNPTGLFRVKAKTAMQYPAKIYDASGNAFVPTPGFKVMNRSDIRLSVKPEVMQTSMFTGIVLRLQAIKIIDVPSFDDGMSGTNDAGGFTAPVAGGAGDVPTGDTPAGGDSWD